MSHKGRPPALRHGPAYWVVLSGFLAAAAFYLWTEHRAHLLGALPYLVLLACPLMHRFMHHGHGGHGTHGHGNDDHQPQGGAHDAGASRRS